MEENFDELLESYWDQKIVDAKLDEDYNVEEETVYDSRIDSPFGIKDEISIDDFVNKYLRIQGNFKHLRHFELKNMNCPYVIGVKNEYADNNPDFVTKKKYLLIVIDRNGNRGTYINPIIAREYYNYDYKKDEKDLKKTHEGFENLAEFIEDFMRVKVEYDAYKEFFNIIKENKKITKFNKIKEYEKNLGDVEDDKHKGR